MAKILVVEDDSDLGNRLSDSLTFEQHTVELVTDGKEASERLKLYQYDLVVLDWDLPGLSGVEVLRRYRATGGKSMILMLTGKSELSNKEEGLESGADDYLTKPFHMKELAVRIRALMRRAGSFTGTELTAGNCKLNLSSKLLTCDGAEVSLSPREYAVMEFFMRHPDEVYSQEQLLEKVWSSESDASIFSVYTVIKNLRKKIAGKGKCPLVTVHGMGYRLESI